MTKFLVDGGRDSDETFAEQLENGTLATLEEQPNTSSAGNEETQMVPYAVQVDDAHVIAAPVSDVVRFNVEQIEVTLHRRIKKNRLSTAKRLALYGAKARFGTPVYNSANIKAVHQFVYNSLSKSGVQEGQMCMVIPPVVNLVFIPNKYEVEAKHMFDSPWSWWRRRHVAHPPQC